MGLQVQGEESLILKICLRRLTENVSMAEFDRYLCKKPLESKIVLSVLNELFDGLDIDFFRDMPNAD